MKDTAIKVIRVFVAPRNRPWRGNRMIGKLPVEGKFATVSNHSVNTKAGSIFNCLRSRAETGTRFAPSWRQAHRGSLSDGQLCPGLPAKVLTMKG
jgi:hypothetical protein